jgi:hypothetical protein
LRIAASAEPPKSLVLRRPNQPSSFFINHYRREGLDRWRHHLDSVLVRA